MRNKKNMRAMRIYATRIRIQPLIINHCVFYLYQQLLLILKDFSVLQVFFNSKKTLNMSEELLMNRAFLS